MKLFKRLKSAEIKSLTFEEYFNRFQTAKKIVESDEKILKNIKQIFRHQYLNEALNNDNLYIDSGQSHSVHSVQSNPTNIDGKEIYLALRLGKLPYRIDPSEECNFQTLSEIESFCNQFELGGNPAYFTGIVSWKSSNKEETEIAGFLTQDLGNRNKLKTKNVREGINEFLIVENEKEKMSKHFIDQIMPYGFREDTLKYHTNRILINSSIKNT